MPFTREAAMNKAAVTKATLAASKLRLFKVAFVPNVNSVKADFVAAEADYDGYTPGGITVAALIGPSFNPAGGASVISPISNFAWAHDTDDVGNMIGGWWIETAAGLLWAYDIYPAPIAMAQAGDAIPQIVQLTEGRNSL